MFFKEDRQLLKISSRCSSISTIVPGFSKILKKMQEGATIDRHFGRSFLKIRILTFRMTKKSDSHAKRRVVVYPAARTWHGGPSSQPGGERSVKIKLLEPAKSRKLWKSNVFRNFRGLVIGCIEADCYRYILVRWKALDEIYNIFIPLRRSDLKIISAIFSRDFWRFERFHIFEIKIAIFCLQF